MDIESISTLIRAVASGELDSIEAERLLNAVARAKAGVPTGPEQGSNTHTKE
ncbi:hypothetical protein QIN14_gp1 [ssRNA phage SRR6960799_2]|uniref:Uncharacterized protein n=1 Tax=ssRNA phage SRR6960799_2 TaxID=2786576 RepID=A0A8S5L418_9VIRU|nr:hypothetical protein QIN14_gp1 [ssRNA phage SRR6960799_2]DAD52267.1 TPA_asm: hypothetical protein [ssRNA phage SRR6960799_2]